MPTLRATIFDSTGQHATTLRRRGSRCTVLDAICELGLDPPFELENPKSGAFERVGDCIGALEEALRELR